MTFPATNLNEAVGLIVPDSNAFHNVINGDVNEDVTLPEGGEVPTLRKALESLKVVGDPIGEWTSGVTEFTAYNQYATYLGIPWRVKPETILPYTAQGSDPSSLPDSDFVQPYQENDYGTLPEGIEVKHRRGTSAEIAAFTPAEAEIIVDKDDNSLVVGDGVTQGGFRCALESASQSKTVLVPTDYPDLQSAINAYANIKNQSSSSVTVNIETGHEITKGFTLRGGDFSHITITSTDAVVTTSPSFTGEDPTFIPERLRASVTNPFVCIVSQGATSPVIGFLLDLENKDSGGLLVAEGEATVTEGSGFDNAGDRAYLIHGRANLYGAYGRGCAKTSVRTQQAAQVVIRNFDGSGSCTAPDGENQAALYLSRSTICEARGSNFSNSGAKGLIARRSIVTADDANFDNAADEGIFSESGSMVSFSGGSALNTGGASVNAATGGIILAGGTTLSRPVAPQATLNVNAGRILVNSGTELNGVNATEALTVQYSNLAYLNAVTPRGMIEFTDGVGTYDIGTESGGRYELQSNGRFKTWSTSQIVDITVAVGDFSGQITLPDVPLPAGINIEGIDFFDIEAVGRTSAGGGGNRVGVTPFNRFPSNGSGSEFKIRNEGIQLDGASEVLTVNSVEFQVKIEGRYSK